VLKKKKGTVRQPSPASESPASLTETEDLDTNLYAEGGATKMVASSSPIVKRFHEKNTQIFIRILSLRVLLQIKTCLITCLNLVMFLNRKGVML